MFVRLIWLVFTSFMGCMLITEWWHRPYLGLLVGLIVGLLTVWMVEPVPVNQLFDDSDG